MGKNKRKFTVGDLVTLKGGESVCMVIEEVDTGCGDDGQVTCIWYDRGEYMREDFNPDILETVK